MWQSFAYCVFLLIFSPNVIADFTKHAKKRISTRWTEQLIAEAKRGPRYLGADRFKKSVDPRNISRVDIEEAIRDGQRTPQGHNRVRFDYNGLVVITNQDATKVITTFRTSDKQQDEDKKKEREFVRVKMKKALRDGVVGSKNDMPIVTRALRLSAAAHKQTTKEKDTERRAARDLTVCFAFCACARTHDVFVSAAVLVVFD